MTVYNFNLGIGWASSGVEYAQAYRGKVLRDLGIPVKFIFTDMITYENIEHMTKNIGFTDEEVIWLYTYYTDYSIEPTSYTREQLEQTFEHSADSVITEERLVRYRFPDKDMYVNAYLTRTGMVYKTEYVLSGYMIRADYFWSGKVFSDFYAPKDGNAVLYLRHFYHKNGTVAYEVYLDGEKEMIRMGEQIFYTKEEFFRHFFRDLGISDKDVIIADRTTDIGQTIFAEHGKARLGIVVHADHYNDSLTDDEHILWNNYYEYDFSHHRDVAFYICSTDRQSDMLREHFKKYSHAEPYILTIPVGSLDRLRHPEHERRHHTVLTASRLAPEKHVDWLVQAVAMAHETIPDLTFDIYGKGGEEKLIRETMVKYHAESFVHLMGHQDMTDIYRNYSAYIAASTSEGFGLTLLEAVGSGLPMVGYDVPYGNQTFIDDGENGYLIDIKHMDTKTMIRKMADAIVRLFTEADLKSFSEHSYAIAAPYLDTEIEQKWKMLLE